MDETSFIEVFNRLQELAKINKEGMNMEQLKDHLLEIKRIPTLGLKLPDETADIVSEEWLIFIKPIY